MQMKFVLILFFSEGVPECNIFSQEVLGLGLPQISKSDSWELLVLGTAPFSQAGGWAVLTGAR